MYRAKLKNFTSFQSLPKRKQCEDIKVFNMIVLWCPWIFVKCFGDADCLMNILLWFCLPLSWRSSYISCWVVARTCIDLTEYLMQVFDADVNSPGGCWSRRYWKRCFESYLQSIDVIAEGDKLDILISWFMLQFTRTSLNVNHTAMP